MGLLGLASLAVLAILAIWLFQSIAWIIKKMLGVRVEPILTVCPFCAEETAENLGEPVPQGGLLFPPENLQLK